MTTQENRKKNILTEVISPDNVLHIAESLALRAVTSMLKFRAEGSNPIFVSNDINVKFLNIDGVVRKIEGIVANGKYPDDNPSQMAPLIFLKQMLKLSPVKISVEFSGQQAVLQIA